MTTALHASNLDQAPATRTAAVPVTITPRPISDTEFRIIDDISTISEAAGCNCNSSDDNPY
ncbi:hypothetical protein [Streptomyces sp. NPDC020917]|uniref:hypothetical protein n=1 Tax=Streptomyces sp. NPDC020917 TaxID=3365102 RepID=UPI0037A8FF55